MKTIYEISSVNDRWNEVNAMAATLELAESYLVKNGYERITHSDDPFYQTWVKRLDGSELVRPGVITVTVKKYNNFIDAK